MLPPVLNFYKTLLASRFLSSDSWLYFLFWLADLAFLK